MKSENDRLDDKISSLVRSLEHEIPAGLEQEARRAVQVKTPQPHLFLRHPLLWATGLASAALLLVGMLFLYPQLKKKPEPLISEIRTEFEIKDKNIKIIWIQKKDFELRTASLWESKPPRRIE